eukprot:TRINITY_DN55891_c0_g1_i3.p1 TRINITY_DN55891_c0_g1~~TRINITY_DN55891_c0_g1_i3.p1  ORF type:complete len:157 (+),score=40.62 TRINITY_DN55891_c0_g1_i3:66-536(+)
MCIRDRVPTPPASTSSVSMSDALQSALQSVREWVSPPTTYEPPEPMQEPTQRVQFEVEGAASRAITMLYTIDGRRIEVTMGSHVTVGDLRALAFSLMPPGPDGNIILWLKHSKQVLKDDDTNAAELVAGMVCRCDFDLVLLASCCLLYTSPSPRDS